MPEALANATALTGIRDQEIVLALIAVGTGKAVGQDAAFEIAAKAALDIRRRRLTGGPVESSSQVSRCVWTIRCHGVHSGRRRW